MIRQRRQDQHIGETKANPSRPPNPSSSKPMSESSASASADLRQDGSKALSVRSQWIFLAMASGACAAFNGAFAKLTTNELTTSLSQIVSKLFGLSSMDGLVEAVVRGMFFALNIVFNGVMWGLFTKALAKGTSTTQVSIINTSTNFVFTALLGFMVFTESLPPMWWAGAALLVAGNVIVGRKDETKDDSRDALLAGATEGYEPVAHEQTEPLANNGQGVKEDEDITHFGDPSQERSS